MTRQVTAGQPVTIVARSRVGGFIPDAPLTIDGRVYSDPDCTETFDEYRANGAGEFHFYAEPGTVVTVTVDDPIAADIEPIQFVGVTSRPGGVAAVHPADTPTVHETSPVSELVSDASLVGAPSSALPDDEGGALAMVGVDRAQNIPPGDPEPQVSPQTPQEALDAQTAAVPQDTPDGTSATDPDATVPPAVNPDQQTVQYEPVTDATQTHLEPGGVNDEAPGV